MKLKHVLLSSAAVMMMAGAANAADLIVDVPADQPVAVAGTGWYLSVFGGGTWINQADANGVADLSFEGDMGWLVGAAVGAHITDNLRGEIELSYSQVDLTAVTGDVDADLTDGSGAATYLLGNLWYDISNGSGFTPYIGGGIGAAHVNTSATLPGDPFDVEGWGFAYQVGAGVKFAIADNIDLDVGYRYKAIAGADLTTTDGDTSDNVTFDGSNHVLQVGVTVGF
jgi:opacity protein-like surface antigen